MERYLDCSCNLTDDRLTNGRYKPSWFRLLRQVIIFFMGVGIILYAVVSQGHDVPFLITGLILIGLVPIDEALSHWRR
jgi:hypothetical protein